MISETLWEIRKATTARDEQAVRLAEREMTALLDQLAGCMIVDDGADWKAGIQSADFIESNT
ncbi:hypothetical protein OG568_54350 (plasmid) [Streptomyces sp. NBC_01450]|uniref:hypothetical protein n=1 Tax=Streptomyces sp. NBC_01450 TaxID=2903871 RepID=UPI002E36DE38|nr:hypothetical protein [Streptomyces sp. NBC_01450]